MGTHYILQPAERRMGGSNSGGSLGCAGASRE